MAGEGGMTSEGNARNIGHNSANLEIKDKIIAIGTASPGRKLDIINTTKGDLAYTREVNKGIIDQFRVTDLEPKFIAGVDLAKRNLVKRLQSSGLDISINDLPEVAFIDRADQNFFMQIKGVPSSQDIHGFFDVTDNIAVVYLNNGLYPLDTIGAVFHEIYHSTGFRTISTTGDSVQSERIGYELLNSHSTHNPWLLEEGLIGYETVSFQGEIANNPAFQMGATERARANAAQHFRERGLLNKQGEMEVGDGVWLDPKFCVFSGYPDSFSISTAESSLPASFVEKLISRVPEGERGSFLDLLRKARIDLTLLPSLARQIDQTLGDGAYQRLTTTPRTDEEVWKLIQSMPPVHQEQPKKTMLPSLFRRFGFGKR